MDSLWNKILAESKNIKDNEPIVKRLIDENINEKKDVWHVLASVLSKKLFNNYLSESELERIIISSLQDNEDIKEQIITDLEAYYDRDFACETYLEIILFFRGFQAITSYRIARVYYLKGQKLTAKFFQNRIFEVYAMDIHPNAKLGKGVVIDHGVGLVIGETAEIGDHAFIFHNVTLGSTGHQGGDRHPKIKSNVFIGAGATLLGNITINDNVNIAAGSVVLKDIPSNTTVAGIPAKSIGEAKKLQ